MNTFTASLPIVFLTLYASITDIKRIQIEDWISICIIIYSIIVKIKRPYSLINGLLYCVPVFLFLFLIYSFFDGSIGGGDVKILSALAFFFEEDILFLILVACILGFIYGSVKAIVKGTGIRTMTRFGPFIFLATLLTALGQSPIYYLANAFTGIFC